MIWTADLWYQKQPLYQLSHKPMPINRIFSILSQPHADSKHLRPSEWALSCSLSFSNGSWFNVGLKYFIIHTTGQQPRAYEQRQTYSKTILTIVTKMIRGQSCYDNVTAPKIVLLLIVRPDLAKFCQFGWMLKWYGHFKRVHSVFGKIWNSLWQLLNSVGGILIVTNGQILQK